MQPGYFPGAPAPVPAPPPADDPLARLAASAKGWHSIQLAVLGFIGICGVLRTGSGSDEPAWLQWLAGLLAVGALVLVGLAIYLVGRVAYPFYGAAAFGSAPQRAEAASRQLRSGIRVTFLAVGALAIAAMSAWWPSGTAAAAAGATVAVQVANGQRVCGTLLDAPPGTVRLETPQGQVSIRFADLATIRAVDGC